MLPKVNQDIIESMTAKLISDLTNDRDGVINIAKHLENEQPNLWNATLDHIQMICDELDWNEETRILISIYMTRILDMWYRGIQARIEVNELS